MMNKQPPQSFTSTDTPLVVNFSLDGNELAEVVNALLAASAVLVTVSPTSTVEDVLRAAMTAQQRGIQTALDKLVAATGCVDDSQLLQRCYGN